MPRVSVIIPAYNSETYIRETIGSVLQQTYRDYEIVVVDDGSTDDTSQVVRGFLDDRIRLIHKPNGGTASARNVGIINSSSEYMQFLDADDLILPDKLGTQVELLDNRQDVDVVYSSFRLFFEDHCRLCPPSWLRPPSRDPLRELVAGSIFPPHAALVRRRCVEAVGSFNEELVSAEDWDFWIRLAHAGCGFHFHNQLLALYRQHAASKTKKLSRWRHAHVQVMQNLRTLVDSEHELERTDWYHQASYNYVRWALALLLEGDKAGATDALATAYSLDGGLGHSPAALARLIAEHALKCDVLSNSCAFNGSRWLQDLAACLPAAYPSSTVLRQASGHYWLAHAHQAHQSEASGTVRSCLWRALSRSGTQHMNRGTLSVLLQSIIGQANWSRLKRL